MTKDQNQDQQIISPIGTAGWQRARELFNVEDYAENVFGVIKKVMQSR